MKRSECLSLLMLLALLAIPAWAQVERPQLTWVLGAGGALRPVYGVPGGAALGGPSANGVLSIACSADRCVVKTGAALHLARVIDPAPAELEMKRGWVKGDAPKGDQLRRRQASSQAVLVPEGPALLALAETDVYIFFTWQRQFARWREGVLEYLNLAVEGDVLSLRAAGDGFDYAVAHEDSTWIEHYSARDESVVALASLGPTGAVLLMEGGGALVASAEDVRWMRPYSGGEPLDDIVFTIPGAGQFTAAPGGYVQVSATSGDWLLSAGGAYLLPPPPAPADPEAAQ